MHPSELASKRSLCWSLHVYIIKHSDAEHSNHVDYNHAGEFALIIPRFQHDVPQPSPHAHGISLSGCDFPPYSFKNAGLHLPHRAFGRPFAVASVIVVDSDYISQPVPSSLLVPCFNPTSISLLHCINIAWFVLHQPSSAIINTNISTQADISIAYQLFHCPHSRVNSSKDQFQSIHQQQVYPSSK